KRHSLWNNLTFDYTIVYEDMIVNSNVNNLRR
ncbi:hypothetical protein PPOP_2366, partial [Paenibacillus popilliae ATCC 14706]